MSRPRHRRRTALAASALVLVAALAGGLTHALWSTDAVASVAVIRSGNLDLELVGPPRWVEGSPDLASPHAIALRADGRTADHLATPGDTFTVTQQFRTTLEGDNIRARVTVGWQGPTSFPAGVTGTYRVTPPTGAPSAAVPLGSPVTVPGGTASIAQGVGTWTVTVTVAWTAASDVVVRPSAVSASPTAGAEGTMLIDLRQVRDGDGFRP
ncbi:hypothetical protein [Cellulomonas shaoxiangyii]|uniref:Alternate-type signal peptide domain-containing protein n=1 Tax=Cellulomonas shaoxiangyii TaxID=2566013 RepID=A0A4P7SIM2_9CELL|nr:hypothetical protein [Cellulomonas shaoxiangyii]QCB92926.1 hypothetical protein E5225_04495 [Cellulomonas shaoxiangyii]TGY85386.1 hypothetical protein E5226_06750 [Cellulomonas shaoxiangyii]